MAEDQNEAGLETIVDLDFRHDSSENRQTSVLSWLETSLQNNVSGPTVIYGEFGTGKTITLRELVANLCRDYLRRASNNRAIYVDLNSIDIRAERRSFVEAAILKLRLSRSDIDDLVRLVEQDEICLVLDGVDEMARPYTLEGRREAFQLIKENMNRRTTVLAMRSTYFTNKEEMLEMIEQLGEYNSRTNQRSYRVAELCGLTQLQVEQLLSAGVVE
jgi:DNA replication protein DnaC